MKLLNRLTKSERGSEIVEFALVASLFAPLLMGAFASGMNMVKAIAVNHMVRDLDNMYIHGADFSTSGYQQLALRLGSGVNLQAPAFPGGATNIQANTGTSGDGLIWVTQIMYVGRSTDPMCTSVGTGNCANHDSFVYTQRVMFGNSSLTSQKQSTLGDASMATINSAGIVTNFLTDSGARLPTAAQTEMVNLWQSTLGGLTDGQVAYVAEGYFQSPDLAIGSLSSKGVYARYFF